MEEVAVYVPKGHFAIELRLILVVMRNALTRTYLLIGYIINIYELSEFTIYCVWHFYYGWYTESTISWGMMEIDFLRIFQHKAKCVWPYQLSMNSKAHCPLRRLHGPWTLIFLIPNLFCIIIMCSPMKNWMPLVMKWQYVHFSLMLSFVCSCIRHF